MTAYGRTVAITGLALLVAVSGCRTAKEDRIRVLEAERAAEKREKERLQNELAATHSSQLAAQAEVEKQRRVSSKPSMLGMWQSVSSRP